MRGPDLRPDLRPLRASSQLRWLVGGNVLTGLGTQAALVALPFQVFTETGSALLTGLLGAAELGPLVAMALLGGALADRHDRRRLLLLVQIVLVGAAAALAVLAVRGDPPIAALFVLAGIVAGAGAMANVAESAIVPNLVEPELLRPTLALNFGLYGLTSVIGPALGGVLIATAGLGAAYAFDAVSCLALVLAVSRLRPQPPRREPGVDPAPERVLRSIGDGLRFVRGEPALMGSFAIDLVAMTFGMPRVLFPVLALTVFDAGAAGTGLLFSSVAAGATVAALTTGWLTHARRLGRIVVYAVLVWGGAIALAGLAGSLWLAALLLALAGAADSVSAVCRISINQAVTPDHLRGRMSSVFSLVVTSGPRLGDVEAGAAAALGGVRFSVVSGGLATIAGVAVVVAAFPALWRYGEDAPG